MEKKHNIGDVIDLEVADFSDANNNKVTIDNERHDMSHYNLDEGNNTITNERHDVFHDSSDEGSMIVSNKRCDFLQNKSGEGNTSSMQDF